MEKEVWLHNLTWEVIQQGMAACKNTIILPVGSTEQHGPHLPVGTDTMVAIAVAESAARQAGVLVAPPLWFGWSPHHLVLPGTITIRAEVLVEVFYDLIRSLKAHGFDRFIALNGHRIVNLSWLQIAAEKAKRDLGVRISIFDPAYMSKSIIDDLGWGEIGHADEIESSHMWHIQPGLVKMDRAKDNPHPVNPLYHVDPRYPGDTLSYVPSSTEEMRRSVDSSGGTTGEPSKASQQGGKIYHQHLVEKLVEAIEQIQA